MPEVKANTKTSIEGWTVTFDKNEMALVELALWVLFYPESHPSLAYRERAKDLRQALIDMQADERKRLGE